MSGLLLSRVAHSPHTGALAPPERASETGSMNSGVETGRVLDITFYRDDYYVTVRVEGAFYVPMTVVLENVPLCRTLINDVLFTGGELPICLDNVGKNLDHKRFK